MRNLFDNQIPRLYSYLMNHGTVILYYELAPTGLVHLGVLRSLLRIKELKEYFNNRGNDIKLILRINDRYVSKNNKNLKDSSKYEGVQLRNVPSPEAGFSSFLDWSLNDIYHIIETYDIAFDQILFVDDMYKSKQFQQLIWDTVRRYNELEKIIGESIKQYPQLLHPLCNKCMRMYGTNIVKDNDVYLYHCTYCNNDGKINSHINDGLISFKWETALTWKFLNVSIDTHGLNHLNAAEVSKKIYQELFDIEAPQFFTINLTMGDRNSIVSKSQANFVPVSLLTRNYGKEYIIEKLAKVNDKTLLPTNWIKY